MDLYVQGRVVSFKNAIIILTSNLGSAEIFNAAYKQKKEGGQVAGKQRQTYCLRRQHHHGMMGLTAQRWFCDKHAQMSMFPN